MSATISLILAYKYYIIFPLAVVEGPILAAISGFFISTGHLSFVPVYFIVVFGDAVGDSFFYFLGRWGRKTVLGRLGKFLHITPEKLDQTKKYFESNHKKALVFSKIMHGIGVTGLITAGSVQISYWRFVKTCLIVSLIQSAVIIILGIIFGGAYVQLIQYLNYYSAITVILALVIGLYIVFKKMKFNIKP